MLREFVQLVSEAVDEGHDKGVELFMESLEHDLNKQRIFENYSIDSVMTQIFEADGYEVENPVKFEDVDEDKVDALLQQMEEDGDLD